MWTLFWDMHSGGGSKEDWEKIYIEAPEKEASIIFYNRFGHSPDRVTCTCCGEDYSTSEGKTLEEASAYHRNCPLIEKPEPKVKVEKGKRFDNGWKYIELTDEIPEGYIVSEYSHTIKDKDGKWTSRYKDRDGEEYNKYQTLEEYIKNDGVHVIYDKDIKPEERIGEVPRQGYIWVD